MLFNNEVQQRLDEEFVEACKNQNLEQIKQLAQIYPLKEKGGTQDLLPMLNIYAQEGKGLHALCGQGNIEALSYLRQQPSFLYTQENQENLKMLTKAFYLGISRHHFGLIDILAPVVKKCETFHVFSYETFENACRLGNLPVVKVLLTDSRLGSSDYCYINSQFYEFHDPNLGFRDACENGQYEIVEYLTTSPDIPEHVDLLEMKGFFYVGHWKILEHFIFNLKIEREHPVWEYISYGEGENGEIDNLYKKRELFENLKVQLPDAVQSQPKRKKL